MSSSQLGLLVNFNVRVLKDGIRRFVWHDQEEGNAETLSVTEVRREQDAATSTAPDVAKSANND